FWNDAKKYLNHDKMTCLTGERRSYLKEGKWTFLFPGTISARTYLKQREFSAYTGLTYLAEPLNAIAGNDASMYLNRGWKYLLSNHTHDANGGCAPDEVCKDMEYRYRKATDIGEIVAEDAMVHIAKNLSPDGQDCDALQIVVYNTLPYARDVVTMLDLEVPATFGDGILIDGVEIQPITSEKSSVFVDSIWEVPTILESVNHKVYACFKDIPAMGYKTFDIKPNPNKLLHTAGVVKGDNVLENEKIRVLVNGNGTVDIEYKKTGKIYKNLNYFTTQGEVGNAWKHVSPDMDRKYNSKAVSANVSTTENGDLVGSITAEFEFNVPKDCETLQNDEFIALPIKVTYTLKADSDSLGVLVTLDNMAKDHWLRANFPTGINTDVSIADSHFDIVKRDIKIPDSTGWVEQAFGTHPLRTFASLSDGENGFAVMPKGLFEYEVMEDRTMALTLIRACRIKLAVSEEKMTELPDEGVQCQGVQTFEYALNFYEDDYEGLPNVASDIFTPIKCAVTGRGKGNLPHESSVFELDNKHVHVTAVKKAEDGNGIIIRLYNPTDTAQKVNFNFTKAPNEISRCKMTEEVVEPTTVNDVVATKKIATYRVKM
ncbi:MAG: glycoside hydrolase family 38 C-terminal domain-containing protein, partial [Oscillospiraceae bacterium]